jgi:hypothetical protein
MDEGREADVWGYMRLSKSGSLLTVLAIVASVLVLGPAGAVPCSGDRRDIRDDLVRHDGAIVGMTVDSSVDWDTHTWTHVIRVSEVFKGEFGEEVVVTSGEPCTFHLSSEEPMGALLTLRDDGTWSGNSYSAVDAALLREAASPFPDPDGAEPALLIAGGFGELGVLALDRAGRTVGYGYGTGRLVTDLKLCPGSTHLLEVLGFDRKVGVRRVSDLTVVRELVIPGDTGLREFHCIGPGGRSVLALQTIDGYRIVRRDQGHWVTLYEGSLEVTDVNATGALLIKGNKAFEYTFKGRHLREAFRGRGWVRDARWDTTGDRIAVLAKRSERLRVSVVHRDDERHRTISTWLGSWCGIEWTEAGDLIVNRCLSGLLFDRQLNILDRFKRLNHNMPAYVGDDAFLVDHEKLFRRDGVWKRLRTFFSQYTFDIEALPPGTEIDAPPHS